jgi:23S rRNA (pseudouridine1915-N3)-methyltransferase
MDLELWWLGKTNQKYLQTGIIEYQKRIRYFQRFEIREFPSSKVKRPEDQVIVDDQNLLRMMNPRDLVILLDEKGEQLSSQGFARYLDQLLCKPARKIIFIIGGPYGFGDAMRQRADHLLSISLMTFTHDLVRLIFLEQLYRALTINHNLPYHH